MTLTYVNKKYANEWYSYKQVEPNVVHYRSYRNEEWGILHGFSNLEKVKQGFLQDGGQFKIKITDPSQAIGLVQNALRSINGENRATRRKKYGALKIRKTRS